MKLYYTARYSTCRKIRHSVHSKTAKNEAFFKKNILKCFLLVLGTMERYEVELRLKWNLAFFFFSWIENNIPKKTEWRSLHPKRVQKTEKNVHFILFTLEIKWLVLGAVTKFLFEPTLVLKLWTPSFFKYFQTCAHFSSEPVHGPRSMKNCAVRGVAQFKKRPARVHFPLFEWRKEKTTRPGIEPGSQPIDPSPLRLHGFNRTEM